MNFLWKLKPSALLRYAVAPALFLCAIFKRPVFQWIAVVILAIWLFATLMIPIRNAVQTHRQRKRVKELSKLTKTTQSEDRNLTPDVELFLIRQVNFRITEHLKETYPMASWLWVKRPASEELCSGGVWRIRLSNADPFNFGEVTLTKSGKLTITLLQALPLKDVEKTPLESNELEEDEVTERMDVGEWYRAEGDDLISGMIDELNAQGHRSLTIRENGEVYITSSGSDEVVNQIKNFPPRLVWDEFCQMLKNDEITAVEKPEGLAMSW